MHRNLRSRECRAKDPKANKLTNRKADPKNVPEKRISAKNGQNQTKQGFQSKDAKKDWAGFLPSEEKLLERQKQWEKLFEKLEALHDENGLSYEINGDDEYWDSDRWQSDPNLDGKYFGLFVENTELDEEGDDGESECEEVIADVCNDDDDFDPAEVYKSLLPTIKERAAKQHWDVWRMREHDTNKYRQTNADGSEINNESTHTTEQIHMSTAKVRPSAIAINPFGPTQKIGFRARTPAWSEIPAEILADKQAGLVNVPELIVAISANQSLSNVNNHQRSMVIEVEEESTVQIRKTLKRKTRYLSYDGNCSIPKLMRETIEYTNEEGGEWPAKVRRLSYDGTHSPTKMITGDGQQTLVQGQESPSTLADTSEADSLSVSSTVPDELIDTFNASLDVGNSVTAPDVSEEFIGTHTIEMDGDFLRLTMIAHQCQTVTTAMVRKIDDRFAYKEFAHTLDMTDHTGLTIAKRMTAPENNFRDGIYNMRERDFVSAIF